MTQSFVIYTDGGSRGNPGKAASAAVVYDDAGNVRLKCGKYLGIATNNVAEYTAVIVALEELIKVLGKDSTSSILSFFADSNLVVSQLSGKYRIKSIPLQKLIMKIRELEKQFRTVSYQHIPREKNTAADSEVNKILDEN